MNAAAWLVALLCLAASAQSMPVSARPTVAMQGRLPCRFHAPTALGTGRVEWIGLCKGGYAHGSGMLQVRRPKGPGPAFYGRVDQGVPQIGAIELPSGYIVGRSGNGEIIQASEIANRDAAFTAAMDAARAVARIYRTRHNSASQAYYEKKADELCQQSE